MRNLLALAAGGALTLGASLPAAAETPTYNEPAAMLYADLNFGASKPSTPRFGLAVHGHSNPARMLRGANGYRPAALDLHFDDSGFAGLAANGIDVVWRMEDRFGQSLGLGGADLVAVVGVVAAAAVIAVEVSDDDDAPADPAADDAMDDGGDMGNDDGGDGGIGGVFMFEQ